jgi:general secretion pathway protein N
MLLTAAGWGLLVWVLALLGMGSPIARLPDDPALLRTLPTPRPVQAERIAPLSQYAEVGARPLFSEDRRPQPFSLQPAGEGEQAQAFEFLLTSVLMTPNFQMAIIQPAAGGDSIRMKVDEAPSEAQGWRLVSVEPRAATFIGPQGEKRLELRTYDGTGGTAPTPSRTTTTASTNPVQAPDVEAVPPPPPPPPPTATTNKPTQVGSSLPDTPMTPEAQMEAIRKRIEARRAQLRQEAQRQQQAPTQTPARND